MRMHTTTRRKATTMPKGESYTSSVKWPSREFWDTYNDLCEHLGTTRTDRLWELVLNDFNLNGATEQKTLAQDHYENRARRGPKKKNPNPTPGKLSTVEELERWESMRDRGSITREEFEAKKTQLLGL